MTAIEQKEHAAWMRSAERREAIGETATALCFRNMAWLIENGHLWQDRTKFQPMEDANDVTR